MKLQHSPSLLEIFKWPIAPSFLIKGTCNDYSRCSIYQDGIFNPDTIRGYLADSSDDIGIQNPLSLFQVVPDDFYFEEMPYTRVIATTDDYLNSVLGNRKIIRVDPKNLYKNKSCCDKFRACGTKYEDKCHAQDCRIALLYHNDLGHYHYINDFEKFLECLNRIISEYNHSLEVQYKLQVKADIDKKKLYVFYQCPYSNFKEYFFPIIYAGKVIAVLMQGQRIDKGTKREDIFYNLLNDNQICQEYRTLLADSINDIPGDEYDKEAVTDKCLNAIWRRIDTLEKRINETVIDCARTVVSNTFIHIETEFHEKIKNEIETNKELTVSAYQAILNETLHNICSLFNKNGFIRIYATELNVGNIKTNIDAFRLIGSSSEFNGDNKWNELIFKGLSNCDLDKMQNNDFASHLSPMPSLSDKEVFRIENLRVGNIKYLIWKKYPDINEENRNIYSIFFQFLSSFYHTLWEPYNILRSVELQKKLEMSIRISVHETAQIIPAIINTLEKEYNIDTSKLIKDEQFSYQRIKQRSYKLDTTINRLLLLDNLYKRSSLMFKEPNVKKEWTDLFLIVNSIKFILSESAAKNNQQEITVHSTFQYQNYDLYTDYQLLNHSLFNLVDNAIKYGYTGSNINILVETEKSSIIELNKDVIRSIKISISSYGEAIPQNERYRLNELFYRAKTSKHQEGMGIGLFLVERICDSLGYKIEYETSEQPLCEYNLPVYYHAIKQGHNIQGKRKCPDSIIDEVVNKNVEVEDWDITKIEFNALINSPTYKNTFTIVIIAGNDTILREH